MATQPIEAPAAPEAAIAAPVEPQTPPADNGRDFEREAREQPRNRWRESNVDPRYDDAYDNHRNRAWSSQGNQDRHRHSDDDPGVHLHESLGVMGPDLRSRGDDDGDRSRPRPLWTAGR